MYYLYYYYYYKFSTNDFWFVYSNVSTFPMKSVCLLLALAFAIFISSSHLLN